MRRSAFEDYARFDTCDMTGGVEPAARSEIPSQQQKGLIRQLGDLQHLLARQTMFRRGGRKHISRRKQPPAELLVTRYHKRQVNIATFQALRDTGPAVLAEAQFPAV